MDDVSRDMPQDLTVRWGGLQDSDALVVLDFGDGGAQRGLNRHGPVGAARYGTAQHSQGLDSTMDPRHQVVDLDEPVHEFWIFGLTLHQTEFRESSRNKRPQPPGDADKHLFLLSGGSLGDCPAHVVLVLEKSDLKGPEGAVDRGGLSVYRVARRLGLDRQLQTVAPVAHHGMQTSEPSGDRQVGLGEVL
jgi:hypothetical protein